MPNVQVQSNPIIEQTYLYISGMEVQINGPNVSRSLNIFQGQCRDSTNNVDIDLGLPALEGSFLPAPVVVDITHKGAGGLDQGSPQGNRVYYIYVIADSNQKNPVSGLISLSNSSQPVMPAGYDSLRLIAAWPTNSGGFFRYGYHTGKSSFRTFTFNTPIATSITTGNATSFTLVDLSLIVPSFVNTGFMNARFAVSIVPNAANNSLFLSNDGINPQITVAGQVATVRIFDYPLATVSTVGQSIIFYSVSNAADSAAISVLGYNYDI